MEQSDIFITGVMVTGKYPDRYPLARAAAQAWVKQNYQGKRELLIVDDNPDQNLAVFPDSEDVPANVRQLKIAQAGLTLGELRNIGKMEAAGSYLVQWDDDDYAHRNRLAKQVAETPQGMATIFKWEIHCNLKTKNAFACCGKSCSCKGFPGTMMWPREVEARFPPTAKAEDTVFVNALREEGLVRVLDNDPVLYFRTFHGNNTWTQKHVMKRKPGSRDLTKPEQKYVNQLLEGPYREIVSEIS